MVKASSPPGHEPAHGRLLCQGFYPSDHELAHGQGLPPKKRISDILFLGGGENCANASLKTTRPHRGDRFRERIGTMFPLPKKDGGPSP